MYLGMTTQNPESYRGSGLYWTRHLREHGNLVDTIVIAECQTMEEIKELGMFYSMEFQVVESEIFANLVIEQGENSSGMRGKKQKQETRLKISRSLLGHKVTEETRKKLSDSNSGKTAWNKGVIGLHYHSEEHKQKLSDRYKLSGNPFFGREHSDSFKEKQRNKQKEHVSCPYCGKQGAVRIMKRWHFNNCKERKDEFESVR
jgi:hypothetical protein